MAMTLVSTVQVPSGGAASIEFTNIPQTGKDLLCLMSLRGSNAANDVFVYWRINSDSTSKYRNLELDGTGSAVSSFVNASDITEGWTGRTSAGNNTANTFGNAMSYFSNYTSTTNKSVSSDSVSENNATGAEQYLVASRYTSSSAITSLSFLPASGNFVQHSSASLYIIS